MKIKKAVIPVAGKGTRFLPATKEMAKEIIPILNIPMIHYAVKEAVDSNIEEIIFVTSSEKEELEKYFQRNIELEKFLEKNNKTEYFEMIKNIGEMVNIKTVEQKEQLGLGHAILMAEDLVDGDDFCVLLADDILVNNNPVTSQLISVYEEFGKSVIGVMEVPNQDTGKYGIVDGEKINNKTLKMNKMVEKPSPQNAPTNLATPGRYVLSNEIFNKLKTIERGAGGEYQLTDAINSLCVKDDVFAHIFEGKRYDTGSLKGYFEATIDFALKDESLREFATNLIKEKARQL